MEGVSSVPEPMSESREAMSADQSSRSSKRRAKVWGYVDSEQVDGVEKAICKFCKIQLSSVAGKGTTHLNRHIQFHCPAIPQEDRDTFIATLKGKSSDGDTHIFDPVVFRGLIAKYFISAEIAFRKAEDPCWKEMINYCQPSFKAVGRQCISLTAPYCSVLALLNLQKHIFSTYYFSVLLLLVILSYMYIS